MKTITTETFDKEVLQADKPTMVKFTALWCRPCSILQPVLDDLAKELEGKVNIYKLDVDDSPEIASKYKVRSIPTIIVFKSGSLTATQVGSTGKAELLKLLALDDTK